MKLIQMFRQSPEERMDDMFWTALPKNDGHRQRILRESEYVGALAARHTADRIVGPMLETMFDVLPDGTKVNFGEWLEMQRQVEDITQRGVQVGYIIGQRLLQDESPDCVLQLHLECEGKP